MNEAMSESLSLGSIGAATRDRTRTLFGQTMGYVAVTVGFFALGAYLGRHLSPGWAIVWFIAGFGAAGYATRRDLSAIARLCFWALVALIVFGIVLIFVRRDSVRGLTTAAAIWVTAAIGAAPGAGLPVLAVPEVVSVTQRAGQ